MESKCFKWAGICVFGAGIMLFFLKANAVGLVGNWAEGIEMAEYDSTNGLALKIQADRVYTDYEQHGFFRIGLLPVVVVENIKIQIVSAESLTNALSSLREWQQASIGARHLEMRNLEVMIVGEARPRFFVRRARVDNNDMLELFDVSWTGGEGRPIFVSQGLLQVAGSHAGRLSWVTGGHTEELFPLNPKFKIP